ncbi:MAG: diphosphomevalonate decarboxylase [Chromatiales bacterium]|jgi:diphosphomevalonate decarboxylase|nr:MAG: diphosphomevalonate decarboxylase [Chromatiales bacterium]
MRAVAVAHPNVALIKYWGKRTRAGNLPATGSLSIVLGGLATETTVRFDPALHRDRVVLDGLENAETTRRVSACLDLLRQEAGVSSCAEVSSHNDFPTGAGLASSASGFAALVTAGAGALGLHLDPQRLAEIARSGSGSAPRSLLGGVVLLTNRDATTVCEQIAAPADWPLEIVVAVTTAGPKATSSREGMAQSEATSPYYDAWLQTHAADLDAGLSAVRTQDFGTLAGLAEHNCLKMHAVMMTTRPPLLYWTPGTLACLHRIQELRRAGVPVFFTVDAGPQVKAVCLPAAVEVVAAALRAVPGVLQILRSPLGEGARLRGSPD